MLEGRELITLLCYPLSYSNSILKNRMNHWNPDGGKKTEILQQRNYWEEEEDLQSVFHIDDNGQSQEHGASASAQSFHGW